MDHVSRVVLFDARAGKVMYRFRRYHLAGEEDVMLSLVNNIECGTLSTEIRIGINARNEDGFGQANDSEIKKAHPPIHGDYFELSYCYFINAGYVPRRWQNFSIRNPQDIRLPH
jgi:hypothetical protein